MIRFSQIRKEWNEVFRIIPTTKPIQNSDKNLYFNVQQLFRYSFSYAPRSTCQYNNSTGILHDKKQLKKQSVPLKSLRQTERQNTQSLPYPGYFLTKDKGICC